MMFIEEPPLENNLKKLIFKTNGISTDLKATGQLKEANGHKSVDIDLDEVREAERGEITNTKDKTLGNIKLHDLSTAKQTSNKENQFVNQSKSTELECRKAAGDKEEEKNEAAPAASEANVNKITIITPTIITPTATLPEAATIPQITDKEEEEEEIFTLLDVFDCGHETEANKKAVILNEPKETEVSDEIVIQIQEDGKSNSEFTLSELSPLPVTSIDNKSENYRNRLVTAKEVELPPVPDALPIEVCFQLRRNQSTHLNGREDRDLFNALYETHQQERESNERFEHFFKDSQMGFDFINKLKKYFNIGNDSNEPTAREDKSRKRRLEECVHGLTPPNLIKYRKVDNHFPKFITHTLEDDMNPQTGRSVFQPPLSLQLNSNNLTKNNKTMLIQDQDRNKQQQEKQQHRSLFVMPSRMNKFVRNTSYADIEFSDDDEEVIQDNAFKAGSSFVNTNNSNVRHVNIPTSRLNERSNILSTLNAISTNSKPNISNTINLNSRGNSGGINEIQRPFVDDLLSQVRPKLNARENDGFSLGARPLNAFISQSMTSNKMRDLNSISGKNTSIWTTNARSIIQQEREREEREKYKELLQKVAPCIYSRDRQDSSVKNLRRSIVRNRRSGLQFDKTTSSVTRRTLGSSQQSKASSIVNLEDSDSWDDEVSVTGGLRLPCSSQQLLETDKTPTAVITLDNSSDDEVSEIVDVDNIISANSIANLKQNISIFDKHGKKNKYSKLPYVAPINSLEDCFNASPHCKDNWLEKFHTKWNENKKLRQRELQETTKVADKIAAERKEAEIRLQERLREFHIVEPDLIVLDDFPEPEVEQEIIPLTKEQQDRIKAAIYGPPDQVLVSKFNMNISRRDIQTLLGNNWLNDEVINFYMNLLIERGEKKHESHGYPIVYAMNTFFIPRLMQGGHSAVKRWTRKIDIFSKDIIPIPVHVGGVHWCMAIIHLKNKTIKYYDSMGTPNPSVLNALENYLKDESLDKRKQPFDTSNFVIESVKDVPRQMNGSDCGVFSCMFAEYITRNKDITFAQSEMEYFRHKMILEIVQGELLR